MFIYIEKLSVRLKLKKSIYHYRSYLFVVTAIFPFVILMFFKNNNFFVHESVESVSYIRSCNNLKSCFFSMRHTTDSGLRILFYYLNCSCKTHLNKNHFPICTKTIAIDLSWRNEKYYSRSIFSYDRTLNAYIDKIKWLSLTRLYLR